MRTTAAISLPVSQPAGGESGVAGRLIEGCRQLGQDRKGAGEPSSGLVDQPSRGLEVQGQGDVRLVRRGSGSGGGQQVGVDGAGEVGVGAAVVLPVAVERVAGVGDGALQDLDAGDLSRAGQGGEGSAPSRDVGVLGGRIEEREGPA
ncbi:hypothetical protein GCM10020295_36660 [Streptomyces cinereospinus]